MVAVGVLQTQRLYSRYMFMDTFSAKVIEVLKQKSGFGDQVTHIMSQPVIDLNDDSASKLEEITKEINHLISFHLPKKEEEIIIIIRRKTLKNVVLKFLKY